jgi:hypothetical protein
MFNAQIMFTNYGGRPADSTVTPTDRERAKREANENLFRSVLEAIVLDQYEFRAAASSFDAIAGIVPREGLERIVREYQWANGHRPLQRQLEFMIGTGARDPGIRDWVLIAPQLQDARGHYWTAAGRRFTVKQRSRIGERVNVFTEPDHKNIAAAIISRERVGDANPSVENFRASGRGVVLFYPVYHREPFDPTEPPTMGISLLFPHNEIPTTIVFGVADPLQPEAPVVDARP